MGLSLERWRHSIAVLLGVVGCSSARPEYAAPKFSRVDHSELEGADLIPYRPLSIGDFRATSQPPGAVRPNGHAGAMTCVTTLGAPDNRVIVTRRWFSSGAVTFEGRIERARFHALMDRSCSWWNPKYTGAQAAYVLEHEQIHFALHEVEMRRLNASLVKMQREQFTAPTSADALRFATEKIRERLEEARATIVSRNVQFDEETSSGFRLERQKEWLARVTSELNETGPDLSASQAVSSPRNNSDGE